MNYTCHLNFSPVADNVKAICPFLDRIPRSQHEEFLEDFINIVTDLDLRQCDIESGVHKFNAPYKLIVAYAKKPSLAESLIGDLVPPTRQTKDIN